MCVLRTPHETTPATPTYPPRLCEPTQPAVTKQHVEIVLTAHPTQVNRRTLQHKHSRIAALLAQNDRQDLTQEERDFLVEELIRWVGGAGPDWLAWLAWLGMCLRPVACFWDCMVEELIL